MGKRSIACCSSVPAKWTLWTLRGGYSSDAISSTTWVWNLHAEAHDYSSQLIPSTKVVTRLFATHFGHLSIVSAWFSAAFISGARLFTGPIIELCLLITLSTHPLGQLVWSSIYSVQETIDQDSINSSAIRITSGVFYVWRTVGLVSGDILFVVALAALVLALVWALGGWYHYHSIICGGSWFNDLESILVHHLTTVIGLACLGWAGHLIHVAYPIEILLSTGLDPQHLPSPRDLLTPTWTDYFYSSLIPRVGELDWRTTRLPPCITWLGSMNPATACLYLSDIIHWVML